MGKYKTLWKEEGKMIKEIQGYLTTIDELQDQMKKLLDGLPEEALDWRPIEGEGEKTLFPPCPPRGWRDLR